MICGRSSNSRENKKEWFQAKQEKSIRSLLKIPNLPYYLDEDVQLVQSDAILRYLFHKYNLMGIDKSIHLHLTDMLSEEVRDLDSTLIQLSYKKESSAVSNWLCSEELRDKMNIREDLITSNNGSKCAFVTGSTLTVVL
jgi:hypothetical protein